ncbi:MAG TPA: hypothetical protein VFL82_12525 [Thermomicrobiales bacterium]|nr:hypothetical protein [Thermomicrobiales bacterium]
MQVVDFANSYVTFFTKAHQGENIARIQIDAVCTLVEDNGAEETFYLIAPCRSERMYRDDQLFQMPNYEFSGIFTNDECVILRTHWTSEREQPEYGRNTDRFDHVAIDIRHHAQAEPLADRSAIVEATLANRPLVARTRITRPDGKGHALLEYPIKTMNVTRNPAQYQVDTGPLIVPNFESDAQRTIERFDVAHVVYHTFDQAEFVLRRPLVVGEHEGAAVSVTDYSVIRTFAAENEVVAGAGER